MKPITLYEQQQKIHIEKKTFTKMALQPVSPMGLQPPHNFRTQSSPALNTLWLLSIPHWTTLKLIPPLQTFEGGCQPPLYPYCSQSAFKLASLCFSVPCHCPTWQVVLGEWKKCGVSHWIRSPSFSITQHPCLPVLRRGQVMNIYSHRLPHTSVVKASALLVESPHSGQA